jgi:hypothetical protein
MNTRGARKKSLGWIRLLQQWALMFDESHGAQAGDARLRPRRWATRSLTHVWPLRSSITSVICCREGGGASKALRRVSTIRFGESRRQIEQKD